MKKIFLSLFFIMSVSIIAVIASNWKINNDKTLIGFKIKGPFGNVNGTIKNLQGNIKFDEKNISEAKIDVTADVSTLKTGVGLRDGHLQKAEWFNASKFPTIHFVSQSFSKTGAGFNMTGTLTIKDVSKSVSFPFAFTQRGTTGTFKGNFSINRLDFGVGGKSFGVGTDVQVFVEVSTEIEN